VYRQLCIQSFLTAVLIAIPAQSQTSSPKAKTVLYAATGPELATYSVDIDRASLARQASVTLPENVQEAWPHPSRRYLYVAWSNNVGGSGGRHGASAFRIDPADGRLQPYGDPIPLTARSVFITVDIPGEHLIVAYNQPSGVTVHRINADGTLGAAVPQPDGLDFGVYAHQVRVDPSNRMVIVVARGNGPTARKAEEPGALKVFSYQKGLLANRASIAPSGGVNFQPRHLEFHPSRPFAFITLERQNKLQVYRLIEGPTLSPQPLFTSETLADWNRLAEHATSTIHAHPNGQFLYVGNRATGITDFHGTQVFSGGENSIAVYRINPQTGEPSLIQNADTRGVHPRTFTLHSSGRILVVANMQRVLVRDNGQMRPVPASLAVFRIARDGKLDFIRKYDQDTSGGRNLFWTGMLDLP
jgi:6-phosphogluconolactonase (cycloisomerase 2 family)